jgi:hypothetical protein
VKIYRTVRWVMLVGLVLSIFLMVKKPAPVARPLDQATLSASVQSYQDKMQQLEQAQALGQSQAEVRLTADEVTAAMSQAGAIPAPAVAAPAPTPTSADAPVDPQPKVNDYEVSFEGDVARGQFSTEVQGKQIYVTIAGHLGAREGYVTFDPTEFKIGDLSIPVSMVNERLQQRLMEQRERLKLPDFIGDLWVENGELVIKEK